MIPLKRLIKQRFSNELLILKVFNVNSFFFQNSTFHNQGERGGSIHALYTLLFIFIEMKLI